MTKQGDRTPLLTTAVTPNPGAGHTDEERQHETPTFRPFKAVTSIVTLVFVLGLVVFSVLYLEKLPDNPERAALKILEKSPIIDGHIDLSDMVRFQYRNNISEFNLRERMGRQVDIPRLRAGKVGGFFWSVYVECEDSGSDFMSPTNRVRDTLDGHQLGNSIAVLRQYYALGARYMTLTHACNNPFADSAGIFEPIPATHGGLSSLGRELVLEMNRLGMIFDLSHTSDETAIQALKLSRAPVIWSHSAARGVFDVPRNVPDHILKMVGLEPQKGWGSHGEFVHIMFNEFGSFSRSMLPLFLGPNGTVTVSTVADHIEHIGKVAGREHVGIGSDFDGIDIVPKGLEDVSKYPALFAELLRRRWSRKDLEGLSGKNFLRVFQSVERVSSRMRGIPASLVLYDKRVEM
ncbi:Metallo-dependent hydrolase [Ceratobasidium sp. AG-I]|nr:Metallo-dependent hydrolase [Ceratobasidium sp. AG-I]